MTLEFAESMNIQRDLVYKERDRLIRLDRRLDGLIEKIAREVFAQVAKNKKVSRPDCLLSLYFRSYQLSG